jgi:hypothetical protein
VIQVTRFHDVPTTWKSQRAVVSAFERRVAIWELASGEKIAEFDTVVDFGALIPTASAKGEDVLAKALRSKAWVSTLL